jgi:hypothetical protein
MRKTARIVGIAVLLAGMTSGVEARNVYGTLAFESLSMLFSPDIDGFTVSRTTQSCTGRRTIIRRDTEEIEGVGSWVPTLKAGIRLDANALYADISFSSTSGAEIGVGLTDGGQRAAFSVSIGYLMLSEIDVETNSGWGASDDEFDLSGPFLKLGSIG